MSFASFPLESLGLPQPQLQACQKAGLSVAADVLLPSPIDLNKKLRFSRPQQVHDLIAAVSRAIAPSSSRVSELVPQLCDSTETVSARAIGKRRRRSSAARLAGLPQSMALVDDGDGWGSERGWIRTGDGGMDRLLGGGLKLGCITEVAGESAAGKSHLCLSLAVAAQLSSLSTDPGGTIFLTSERDISTDRLLDIATWMRETHGRDDFLPEKAMTDNIHTNRTRDVDALDHALSYAIPVMLAQRNGPTTGGLMGNKAATTVDDRDVAGAAATSPVLAARRLKPVRLIVLDSITALLRGAETAFSSSASGLSLRSRHLCDIADKLKALAVEYNLAVLVVNQVTDVFGRQPVVSAAADGDGAHRSSSPPVPAGTQRPFAAAGGVSSSQWSASQHPGHSQAFYTEGDDPPMRYATQSRWFSGQSESLAKEASLGIVWANAVNTRIMLSRTGRRRLVQPDMLADKRPAGDGAGTRQAGEDSSETAERVLLRRAHLIFSPFAPSANIDYVLAPTGIHTLTDSYKLDDGGQAIKARAAQRQDARQALLAEGYEPEDLDAQPAMLNAMATAENRDDEYTELPSEFWNEEWEQAPLEHSPSEAANHNGHA